MPYKFFWELEEAYEKKYGIIVLSNWGNKTILEKKIGINYMRMQTGLSNEKINEMMETGLEMGTNYLEDCMIAAGKKWTGKKIGSPRNGAKL